MSDVKLTLNIRTPPASNGEALTKAAAKKASAIETMDEAWLRILVMKNSDGDNAKLIAVKRAMADGKLGRAPDNVGKRFSKAEALRMYTELAEQEREGKLADMVANTPDNYVLVDTVAKLQAMITEISKSEFVALDMESFGEKGGALDPWVGTMAGFSLSNGVYNYYVPLNHTERTELNAEYSDWVIVDNVVPALANAKLIMHNAPFDCKWFAVKYDANIIDALYADTRIIAMALDENRDHRLKNLLTDWLKEPSSNFDELFNPTKFHEVPLDVALVYAAGDTEKTLKLFEWTEKHLNSEKLADLKRLIFDIEMPVARQFIKADLRGIRFDVEMAKVLDEKLAKEEAELQAKIFAMIGEEINLNSPAQVKTLFFEKLKLTDHGKGSTNSRFIKKITREHPVVPLYTEFKETGKLRQSFTQKLPNNVKRDGKIHPWHNTYGAATGRFTCKDPNTQQIPAKRPEIRHLFKATGDDRILVSMDYSQIELRVLAHVANETILIEAFENGRDIHSVTAALISNGKYTYEDVEQFKDTDKHDCKKLRKQAKIVNFGIVYGMGANKLADTLEITQKEAQVIIDDYFRGYPGIKRYMDEQHQVVRKQGFVTDIFGRKRRLHNEVKSREKWKVLSAERMAGNFPIQSGAGGVLKKAMVQLDEVLPKYDVVILLQCHDELLYDCPRDIKREHLHEIRDTMANAVALKCPVKCDIEIYPERWQLNVSEEEFYGEGN